MRVARLHIEGFRGIRSGDFALRPKSVIVGPNGCGKSTIIDALSLVLGRARMVRQLTEHDFTASNPQPADRIRIIATLRTALGYVVRQKAALLRYLDDGRLVMDNNRSERELRRIAVGRKAWLFVGSDDHAQAAGNIFSLVASAKLHGLDPEAYLRDLFRVLGHCRVIGTSS